MEQLPSQETREQLRWKKLSEIEPLEDHHYEIESRDDLAQLIEAPLLAACQDLYDKNVQTYMSSANKKDIGRNASFSIIYQTLSAENKIIAQKLIDEKVAYFIEGSEIFPTRIQIEIPITKETTCGDVEDASLKVTERFVSQQRRYTPDDLMDKFYSEIENDIRGNEITPEYFEKYGYSYDPVENIFYKRLKSINGEF